MITAIPRGAVGWGVGFRLGRRSVDRLEAADVVAAAASLCRGLAELHRRGHTHRAIGPDTVLLVDGGRRAVLRDFGAAALPIEEGIAPPPYPAPEQGLLSRGRPGAATDVYQLAALVRHTLVGHPPGSGVDLPVRAGHPEAPAVLDDVLGAALAVDPGARPKLPRLRSALSEARRQLARPV